MPTSAHGLDRASECRSTDCQFSVAGLDHSPALSRDCRGRPRRGRGRRLRGCREAADGSGAARRGRARGRAAGGARGRARAGAGRPGRVPGRLRSGHRRGDRARALARRARRGRGRVAGTARARAVAPRRSSRLRPSHSPRWRPDTRSSSAAELPESSRFPDDLVPLTLLAVAYLIVSRGLLQVVGDLEVLQPDFPAAAAEAGLGAVIALCAIGHPWDALVVIPVAFAVNEAHARVRRSRLETLHALETFANIVDERDPYTYRHSMRVAGHVDSLARALGLPYSDIDRLRWAARLHDLGKVAVDAAVLGKSGKLTPAEWGAVWRAPRLSARLLRRFEVSAERGARGRVPPRALRRQGVLRDPAGRPAARRALPRRRRQLRRHDQRPPVPPRALEGRGARRDRAQHRHAVPSLRRQGVRRASSAARIRTRRSTHEEQEQLRGAAMPYRIPDIRRTRDLRERPGARRARRARRRAGRRRARRALARRRRRVRHVCGARPPRLGAPRARTGSPARSLPRSPPTTARSSSRSSRACSSRRRRATGSRSSAGVRTVSAASSRSRAARTRHERALMSWLLREAESHDELLTAHGHELGGDGAYVALPLRRENSALTGFLVVHSPHALQRSVPNRARGLARCDRARARRPAGSARAAGESRCNRASALAFSIPRRGDLQAGRSAEAPRAVVPEGGKRMLRMTWIYRIAFLAALVLAAGAGTKWH